MSDELDALAPRERSRVRARDRKQRGPRVVVDNAGLKKLTVELARRRREQARDRARSRPAGDPE